MHTPSCPFRPFARAAAISIAILLAVTASPSGRADIAATWNGTTGAWTDAARWSTNPVFPNNATPNFYDVTINAGAVSLDQAIQINQLSLGGGTLDGTFQLTAAEGLQWTGGTIAGSGTLTLGTGSSSSFASAGTLILNSRTVEQKGAATFNTGTIQGGSGAVISNAAGATFTALNQAAFYADPGNPTWTFNNEGSFTARATTGAGFTSMDATFNNSGTVSIQVAGGTSHTLQFGAGGTHSGTFALGADTEVVFGGTTSFQAGAGFTGTGAVYTAGDVTLATDLSLPNLNVVFGALDVATHGLSVGSTAEFGTSAVLALEIGGATAGSYGALEIGTTALLDGQLEVRLANGFIPAFSDSFPILTTIDGLDGVFSNVPADGDLFTTTDGLGTFMIDYTDDAIFLTNFVAVIPEPNGAIFGLACLPVFLSVRMRRRIIR